MLSRRRLLVLGGLTGGAALAPFVQSELAPSGTASTHHPHVHDHAGRVPAVRSGPAVTPFSVRMPVPATRVPSVQTGDTDIYRLSVQQATAQLLPGVNTPVLTYGGAFCGPTIRARRNRRTLITFDNKLGHDTNVHLHGGRVAAAHDGYPTDVIAPGAGRAYLYPNAQPGATLWYHDHAHHLEAENVYRGLHGFYLIDDEAERRLGLPSGGYDVPIMLRDALLDDAGNLIFDPADPYNRPTLLANGKAQPYFEVAARKYRFRLLNSSTHRVFELTLDGAQMTQIATDVGLLPAPVPVDRLVLSSGERADIVVDFAKVPLGGHVTVNDVAGPVLRFDVVRQAADRSRVPALLRPLAPAPVAVRDRKLVLSLDPVNIRALINDQVFDPARVDMQVKRGTTEIWEVTNTDTNVGGSGFGVPHNFHTHLSHFLLLDRDGKAPPPGEGGWKDTVLIQPGETVRLQVDIGSHLGRYVYHCHMLEHSALGMMGQMEIVN
ncbi:multicopper oxidase family protein [Nonomuraea gerenzanensis]|uniref:Multicopper oxidase CueO n=1 Tax=Nonomuraea gerenzanensis TaxID=93944 RepID=A0A1M4EAP6_9ACTN|nr:multicopper oxidase family protein [Nonomuraea gerenzanensis]UBU18029.1 multicopper oxidase family protein [Nonomuraea gerenzanensis]SBO95834.1 Multicopper oxidase [Nonomuraea gerenzanensis]